MTTGDGPDMRGTTNLSMLLRQTAARYPDRPALVHGDISWTWREMDQRADALAGAMADSGIGRGSVVLLHSPNARDFLTVMFATWRLGAVITPTNFRLTPAELDPLVEVVRPDLAVVGAPLDPQSAYLGQTLTWILSDESAHSGPEPTVRSLIDRYRGNRQPDLLVNQGHPCWYIFTSGSSGKPKAAVLTHDQMAFVINNHIADLMPGLGPEDAALILSPLSHGAGVHALVHVARGAAIVLMPDSRLRVDAAWDLVARHRISTLFTVPTILNRLVSGWQGSETASLRYVIYAGAPIALRDQRRAREVLGPVLVQYYGLAEVTGAITVLPADLHDEVPTHDGIGSAGFARTGMTISIQAEDGRELPVRERGEICVAGPAVFAGYLRNPEADARAFRDGWFRTGDLGLLDESGLLYITGRASDVFISGGTNVDPREVEELMLRHPGIRQVGVVGVPDPDWGEVGFAVCVVDPVLTAEEVMAWCRQSMAGYKAPRHACIVDTLPTAAYGKVTTSALRDFLKAAGLWPA